MPGAEVQMPLFSTDCNPASDGAIETEVQSDVLVGQTMPVGMFY